MFMLHVSRLQKLSGVFPAEADGIGLPRSSSLRLAFSILAFGVAAFTVGGTGSLLTLAMSFQAQAVCLVTTHWPADPGILASTPGQEGCERGRELW